MENFALGDIKILICTNIVESGLDIQNANTIIVQDVQQFGLAQLYQVLPSLFHFSFVQIFKNNVVQKVPVRIFIRNVHLECLFVNEG